MKKQSIKTMHHCTVLILNALQQFGKIGILIKFITYSRIKVLFLSSFCMSFERKYIRELRENKKHIIRTQDIFVEFVMIHNWKDNLIHFFQKFNIVWGHISQINSATGFPISKWCSSSSCFTALKHYYQSQCPRS